MTAQAVNLTRATPADRARALAEQLRAVHADVWADALAKLSAAETALNDLDIEGMPPGVRDIARRLAEKQAEGVQSMAAIMERRR